MSDSSEDREFLPSELGEDGIARITGWRRLVLWPLSIIARLWCASIRIRMSPRDAELLSSTQKPIVIILWHNRLFMAADIYRRFRRDRRVTGLVSTSRDGAWLAAFFDLMGVGSVRGSSSKRSLGATRELLNRLEAGSDIALTPDGPRGPCYKFRQGALRIAKRADSPIMLVSGSMDRYWRLKSWDGFYLPRPFSTVDVRVAYFDRFTTLGTSTDEEAAEFLRAELLRLTRDESGRH